MSRELRHRAVRICYFLLYASCRLYCITRGDGGESAKPLKTSAPAMSPGGWAWSSAASSRSATDPATAPPTAGRSACTHRHVPTLSLSFRGWPRSANRPAGASLGAGTSRRSTRPRADTVKHSSNTHTHTSIDSDARRFQSPVHLSGCRLQQA